MKDRFAIFFSTWLSAATAAIALPGDLVEYSIIDFGANEKPFSVNVSKADNKILIAGKVDGAIGTDWLVARLESDLRFDTTFAGVGYLTKDFMGLHDKATKIAVVDGNIMVAGASDEVVNRMTLARLLPDGTFDATFGNVANDDGVSLHCYDISASDVLPTDLAYDGTNFWMSGSWINYGHSHDMMFGRFFADGMPDQALGPNDGCYITGPPGALGGDRIAKISGKYPGYITMVGSHGVTPTLYRIHANDDPNGAYMAGDPDLSFGVNGWAQDNNPLLNNAAQIRAGHAQKNGKALVAGYIVGIDAFIMRFRADGTPDPNFGVNGDGLVIFNVGLADIGQPQVIKIDKWGHIYIAGHTEVYPSSDLFIVRLNSDGSLDTTFGVGGIATTAINAGTDYIFAIALNSDSDVIAAGKSNGNLLVAKFQGGI